ncbi:MAG: hypothetical protein HC893_02295 [Chloroflexaceae bacterium]|nr:hypothetical protein [Chloroflexaceae bacterium]
MSNIRKHAYASTVHIRLHHSSPRALRITIADDGRGLPPDFDLALLAEHGHYGLLGISERVALLQGKLRLHNQPGGGLLLEVELPHPRIEAATANGRWMTG